MVNNAAGNSISKNDNLSPRGFDAISNIVMNGTFYVTRPCGARWIKAGVAAMTQSLALEWGNRGIRLRVIAPGPFPTKGAWDRLMPNENLARNYTGTVPMGALGNIPNSQI
ncbi:MAG TPA: SDR family oxidoreductase [Alphaproteobacteria bacterium]|nr:SDR family oxidoreductase [Alphaproteobacteria bacterium]